MTLHDWIAVARDDPHHLGDWQPDPVIRWHCPACGNCRETLPAPNESTQGAVRRIVADHIAAGCPAYPPRR